ncbi:hypothetical protein L7F22_027079 [Adiantum nelumboides]|nr:hypothetical protein [Adiantum nelumboides]
MFKMVGPSWQLAVKVPQVEEGKLAKMLAKDLTQEERQAYLAMLEGYPKLFNDGYDQITGVFVVQYHIHLKDQAKPVVQRLRRLGVIQQDALLSKVRKLLNAGFIYPIEDSEWVSPVVVTPKKNGKWRVCVDYKPLNAATKWDHFPLPFQDEILNEVAGYERYTVCDGYLGYFQIRIAEEDQKKTTFVTPWGCFAYRVMPFGLTNAPTTFQRFVTHVFQPFFGKSIRVFIDDFCIYSSRALHLEKLNEGLARLQSLGGQLNVDKCHIAESQVTLLGHVVSSRVEDTFPLVLQHMDVSARISKWLVRLQKFEYTLQVESSTRASLAGMLTHRCYERKVKVKAPRPKPVEVQAKLSGAHSLYFDGAYKRKVDKVSVGISIQDKDGQKVFGKGILVENTHSNNGAEYAALALGLEWCVSMDIKWLNVFGDALLLIKQAHGTWACHNQSLVPTLRRVKELMKRFETIQLYHVPRKENQEADVLASAQLQEVIVGAIKLQNPLFQGSDCMHDIVNFLEIGECPQDMSKGQRQWLVRKATKYRLISEHLYCKAKDLVLRRVPRSKDIKQVLISCHEGVCGGHFAHDITSRKILQAGYVWPSLYRDVQHWCRTCKQCQLAGDRHLTYEPQTPILSYGPFEKWSIDAIGPLPRSNSGKGDLVGELMKNLGIERRHSTPYYPQCNGLVEKVNGMICKIITKQVVSKPKDGDKHLSATLWAYRTSFRTSLGYTPYHLVFGKEAILPIEVQLASLKILATENEGTPSDQLKQRILDLERLELDQEMAIEHYATQAEQRRQKFNEGLKDKEHKRSMLVLCYDNHFDTKKHKKFMLRWEGPYVIRKKYTNGSYTLQDISGKLHKTKVNGWRLKLYFQRFDAEVVVNLPPKTNEEEEEDEASSSQQLCKGEDLLEA